MKNMEAYYKTGSGHQKNVWWIVENIHVMISNQQLKLSPLSKILIKLTYFFRLEINWN